ncbi:MAG: imelysin family protein [Thermoleophilia bacterium]
MLAGAAIAVAAGCGGSNDEASPVPAPAAAAPAPAPVASSAAHLSGIKTYLLEHTGLLTGFTAAFQADAQRYYDLAAGVGFDYARLEAEHGAEASEILAALKAAWVEGNPYYERMEGVVAGTPSLAEFDVILDAGSSAEEDPGSAVPFDLTTPSGTVLKQPGNLYSLTEGMLWGTLPQYVAQAGVDLDGDGTAAFGEVLPDADALLAAAQAFDRYAGELATAAEAWQPTESDAFTALVVMVPTMSEYFGQWADSRFVRGDASSSEAFNVVSRLSDIRDIIGSLDVVYAGVEPLVAGVDEAQAEQTDAALDDLAAFIGDLQAQEQGGRAFTAEEASTLGAEAQERGTAIAGQVAQVAARLGIEIAQ